MMDEAIEVIDADLGEFRRELAQSEAIIQTQQSKIDQLTTQIDTLSKLRVKLEELRSAGDTSPDSQSVQANGDGGLPPSEAIVQLLTNQPNLLAVEVIEILEHRVQSSAKNISHNLRTTLFNLKKKGILTRNAGKRYRVAGRQEE